MTKSEVLQKLEQYYLENDIAFDSRYHRYVVNGTTCAGVSTIGSYRPMPFLTFWAAKEATQHLSDKLEDIKKMNEEDFAKLLETAKKAHCTKSKKAADIGTLVHDWIQTYIETGETKLPTNRKANHAINQFLEFEKRHEMEWIAFEKIVHSKKHNVAGRLDAIAFIDGKLTLLDFKTSSRISDDYYLQTAGYQMCLEEMDIHPEQRVILRLPKEDDDFEAVLVPTEVSEDIEAFLGQRYAMQWKGMIDVKYSEDDIKEVNGKKYKNKKLKLVKI